MRILPAFFASGEDFMRDYRAADPEFDGPALLCRTRGEYASGEEVIVEVDLPRLPNRIRLVGHIAGPGPGGTWVVMSFAHRASLDFVVAHARKFAGPAIRRHHDRFPIQLPCAFCLSGAASRVLTSIDDLSAGGVFVRAFLLPEIGSEFMVELSGTAARPLVLHGQVVWVRSDDRTGGMGVRFATPTGDDSRLLREMLRHSAERGRMASAPV